MARFRYEAIGRDGQRRDGEVDAATRAAALEQLLGEGLITISATETAGWTASASPHWLGGWPLARVSPIDVIVATRQLATLVQAGQPLDRALRLQADHTEQRRLRLALDRVLKAVRDGGSLSAALSAEPAIFSPLYVSMVQAGERGGALGTALTRLAEFLERADAIRKRIAAAMLYPIILLIVTVASVALMLAVVVPQFKPLFKGSGAALPFMTEVVIAASDVVQSYGQAATMCLALLLLLCRHLAQRPAARLRMDSWALRVPLIGTLVRKTETAKFCRTLATLQASGVALPAGLALATGVFGNRRMAAALGAVADRLRQGSGLTQPLSQSDAFPEIAIQLIRSGEESGQLAATLDLVANIYDEQVKHGVERLFIILTPMVTIFLAILIGGVVASILLPLLNLNNLIR